MISVSIIIPIYNTEEYIEKCVVSLFEQDFDSIEYVFVNDCTPDDSMIVLQKILEKYPHRKTNSKIMTHSENKGSGVARKTGVASAIGEYVIQIDSDDWCELDMISSMYQKAKEASADIVVCNFYVDFRNKQLKMNNHFRGSTKEYFKRLLKDEASPSLCDKLIKRKLFDYIDFPNFSLGEDYYSVLQVVYYSKNISYIPKAFLHYNQINEYSITTKKNKHIMNDLDIYLKAVKQKLKEWECWDKCQTDYYIGALSRILVITKGDGFNKIINNIEPESNKLSYLWGMKNKSYLKKIIYSFSIMRMEKVTYLCKKLYFKIINSHEA